jgi:hypothetical protein
MQIKHMKSQCIEIGGEKINSNDQIFEHLMLYFIHKIIYSKFISSTRIHLNSMNGHVTGNAKFALQCLPLWVHHKMEKQQTCALW